MSWIAGYFGNHPSSRSPLAARTVTSLGSSRVWTDDDAAGPARPIRYRLVCSANRELIVIGTALVTDAEILTTTESTVPDDLAWRWSGAYAVVELTEARLSIWSDLATAVPIYTYQADDGVYWSTSARALAGLSGGRLDLERIAGELHAPGTPRLVGDRTYFEGVRLVLPGYRYVFARSGRTWHTRVWEAATPSDPQPTATGPSADLRTELTAAVTVRVRTAKAPSADLSGGLDSTALTLLAAEDLAPERSIAAYTVHEPTAANVAAPSGDLRYALQAAGVPGVDHHLLALDGAHLPYSRLDELAITDEPAPSARAYARFAFQLDTMREQTATDSHMTGDGGDTVLMSQLGWIADAIAQRRFAIAVAEAHRLARLRRIAPSTVLRAATDLLRHTPQQGLSAASTWWREGRATRTQRAAAGAWHTAAAPPPWTTATAGESAASLADAAPTPDYVRGALNQLAIAHDAAEVGRTANADARLAAHHGVVLHNPFVDSRIIDTVLRGRAGPLPRPSDYKPQLRAALVGVYPAELAARTTKGTFTSDYFTGLRVNLPALLDLADGRLAALGLIHPEALRSSLRAAAAGAMGSTVCLPQLDAALSVESWLRSHERAEPVLWSPSATSHGESACQAVTA
ncbi:MAG: albusnodin/ikarugamycin family macrolactam cyclase [Pseudonocardiaceae bacterium]